MYIFIYLPIINLKTEIMKTKIMIMALLASTAFINGCAKKEGCTDKNSLNYDADAEKDNGTCTYKGKAVFWNDVASSLGDVTVTMADGTTGTITSDYTAAPACDDAACFTYTAKPGTYSFDAEEDAPGTSTWTGSVTITSNGCVSFRLY